MLLLDNRQWLAVDLRRKSKMATNVHWVSRSAKKTLSPLTQYSPILLIYYCSVKSLNFSLSIPN